MPLVSSTDIVFASNRCSWTLCGRMPRLTSRQVTDIELGANRAQKLDATAYRSGLRPLVVANKLAWHINCVCNSVLHRTERATKLGSTCEAAVLRRSSAKWSAEKTLLLFFFSEARWCWLRKPLIYMLCLLKLCSQHFCWIPARLLRWVWALCFLGAGSNCTVPVISVPNHDG